MRRIFIACCVLAALSCAYPAEPVTNQTADSKQSESSAKPAPVPAGVSSDWLQQAQEHIRLSEYFITWQDKTQLPDLAAAWHAPNRKNNFRTYFTEKGCRVIPRTGDTTAWEWGLGLAGYGEPDKIEPAAPGKITTLKNRLEIDRGPIVEWFVNDERGLEHGFTIKSPLGKQAPNTIALDLVLTGTLRPVLSGSGRGQSVELSTADGKTVTSYGNVLAKDATGRELPVQMELDEGQDRNRVIRLLIEVAGAEYPITVDPLARSSFFNDMTRNRVFPEHQ